MAHYYDLKKKDQFTALFGDKYIGRNPTGRQNSYMVLSLNFSIVRIADRIDDLANHHQQLRRIPPVGGVKLKINF